MSEDVLIVFGIILGSVALLVIDYLIAVQFYNAADMKGHSESKYLWIPFFLGIIGYLLVIALPDRNAANNASVYGAGAHNIEIKRSAASVKDSLPEL